ncbi:MAG: bifunctional 4-hydroxy-2-oxoglutarate aldolase/2-dehydro-3-deoxy-phosphogluconate aldolase [Bryobacterales bacterium]|nr:bifunctional 4-hydroxy-2-oxoglutarate aldolase/2-dehydro-3-deoxy-phosphogluconate aldolase [Acidobacteriota bacterium]MCB9383297.1 bifunctional 4-hydroxy-2-oxoglutarate aldolase/2-dehydro-3-deoxy-phosphogluconate aldolase [Bryobacterales bacterium]
MSRNATVSKILEVGVVPIVRTASSETALEAARAVHRGGIQLLEVTMTVPGALKVLEKLADELGDGLLLGAGSVLDPETARAAMLAGARFIVTPGLSVRTVEMCKRYSVAALPGALTPTEVITAWEAGADMVKIFPVDNMGGPAYIKALKAPLPQIDMVPTGGVDLDNLADFLKAGASAVAVGSSLMKKAALKEGRYELIEAAAKDFLRVAAAARSAV